MASAIPRFECPTIPKTHLTPQFDMVSAHTSDDVHVRVASGEGSGDFSAKASDLPETAPPEPRPRRPPARRGLCRPRRRGSPSRLAGFPTRPPQRPRRTRIRIPCICISYCPFDLPETIGKARGISSKFFGAGFCGAGRRRTKQRIWRAG